MENELPALDVAAPETLAYASNHPPRWRPFTIGRPISWWLATLLVALWALPAWFGLFETDVDSFYMRPAMDGIVAMVLGCIVFLILVVRWLLITRHEDRPPRRAEVHAILRLILVASTSLALLWFDANGSGVQLAFRWHRAEFEAARASAMAALPPYASASHRAIGPFQIVSVKRGGFDGVAFELKTGSGIEFGNETLLTPPGDAGSLGGRWWWVATD